MFIYKINLRTIGYEVPEAVTAYNRYKPNPDESHGGQWTVVVYMNDKSIGRNTFLYLN